MSIFFVQFVHKFSAMPSFWSIFPIDSYTVLRVCLKTENKGTLQHSKYRFSTFCSAYNMFRTKLHITKHYLFCLSALQVNVKLSIFCFKIYNLGVGKRRKPTPTLKFSPTRRKFVKFLIVCRQCEKSTILKKKFSCFAG